MPTIRLRPASEDPPTTFRVSLNGARGKAIKEALSEGVEEDEQLLAYLTDVSRHDDRAEYEDGTFKITEVTRKRKRLLVDYEYAWSAHYTCADMCRNELAWERIEATVEDDVVVFSFEIREPRSTEDEL
jgi:hypothetical protein